MLPGLHEVGNRASTYGLLLPGLPVPSRAASPRRGSRPRHSLDRTTGSDPPASHGTLKGETPRSLLEVGRCLSPSFSGHFFHPFVRHREYARALDDAGAAVPCPGMSFSHHLPTSRSIGAPEIQCSTVPRQAAIHKVPPQSRKNFTEWGRVQEKKQHR